MTQNTSHRPEQMRLYKILKEKLEGCQIRLEYEIKDNIHPELGNFPCIPDIVILYEQGKKIAIRMMGEVHNSVSISRKDQRQKEALEFNDWKVVDLDKNYYPNLWSGKDYDSEIEAIIKLL